MRNFSLSATGAFSVEVEEGEVFVSFVLDAPVLRVSGRAKTRRMTSKLSRIKVSSAGVA